jgi:AcrR family transcriptional regulator
VTISPERDDIEHDGDRPERADAARNRELILATARRLFAERGISVTLNDIAHEAGVGVGTVYRKFEDKDALVDALIAAKFSALIGMADRALAEPSPREALRGYLLGTLELRASDRALAEVIVRARRATPAIVHERNRLNEAVGILVDRAREAGVLRDGFSAQDIPIVSLMVGVVADRTRECAPDAWRRYAQMVVDGICPPEHVGPLCGRVLDERGIELAMHPTA